MARQPMTLSHTATGNSRPAAAWAPGRFRSMSSSIATPATTANRASAAYRSGRRRAPRQRRCTSTLAQPPTTATVTAGRTAIPTTSPEPSRPGAGPIAAVSRPAAATAAAGTATRAGGDSPAGQPQRPAQAPRQAVEQQDGDHRTSRTRAARRPTTAAQAAEDPGGPGVPAGHVPGQQPADRRQARSGARVHRQPGPPAGCQQADQPGPDAALPRGRGVNLLLARVAAPFPGVGRALLEAEQVPRHGRVAELVVRSPRAPAPGGPRRVRAGGGS